jgi:signal transduction histidine kinase
VNTTDWQPRALFLPFYIRNTPLVVLCFRKAGDALSSAEEGVSEDLGVAADVTAFLFAAHAAENSLRVMEIYIKEIGHDIASSVQATIAKLRNVSRGLIDGPGILKKVREAEEEIMATYRIAETLGITVDPDYRLVNPSPFDAVQAAKQVIVRCQSEATERHIQLRLEPPDNSVVAFGDEKAVQSALTQLLMNAIKYAKGWSYVTVRVREEQAHVEFSVTDRGVLIEKDEEPNLWEFGFRGRQALELHVNGSGIGLYTVKKIALAHGGRYWCRTAHDLESIVTFAFTIPTKKVEPSKVRPLYFPHAPGG